MLLQNLVVHGKSFSEFQFQTPKSQSILQINRYVYLLVLFDSLQCRVSPFGVKYIPPNGLFSYFLPNIYTDPLKKFELPFNQRVANFIFSIPYTSIGSKIQNPLYQLDCPLSVIYSKFDKIGPPLALLYTTIKNFRSISHILITLFIAHSYSREKKKFFLYRENGHSIAISTDDCFQNKTK